MIVMEPDCDAHSFYEPVLSGVLSAIKTQQEALYNDTRGHCLYPLRVSDARHPRNQFAAGVRAGPIQRSN